MKVTVSELNASIAAAIKDNHKKTITVVGEVSNPKVSGRHTYMTLKDASASISVAFWGQQITSKEAKHGDNVEITGRMDFYTKGGNVNLIGRKIEKVGIGSIHAQYEKTRVKYQKKGYFDNKKDLPEKIKDIGVVTAENGAALQDFIRVLQNNKFNGRVFVYNAVVQGPRCGVSVAAGIKFFDAPFYVAIDTNNIITHKIRSSEPSTPGTNTPGSATPDGCITPIESDTPVRTVVVNYADSDEDSEDSFDPFGGSSVKQPKHCDTDTSSESEYDTESEESEDEAPEVDDATVSNMEQIQVDVVVVTRGGGSFEDLMGFSDPKVLEAIHKSKRYTISSVGHEVDNMLSDFASNHCTGTPSMAGDLISQTCAAASEAINKLEKDLMRSEQTLTKKLYAMRQRVVAIENQLVDPIKKIKSSIDDIEKKARKRMWKSIKRYQRYNDAVMHRISAHDSTSLLKNGFCVIVDADGKIVRDREGMVGSEIKIIHETGEYRAKLCEA